MLPLILFLFLCVYRYFLLRSVAVASYRTSAAPLMMKGSEELVTWTILAEFWWVFI